MHIASRKRKTHLRNTPGYEEWSLLGVGEHATSGVVEAEVRGTVDDDTLDGYTESSVQSSKTVSLEDLGQAVAETRELTLSTGFTDIGSQPIYNAVGIVNIYFWQIDTMLA